ncbi:hypothetical protein Tco_0996841 [Tanacetum coccineum]
MVRKLKERLPQTQLNAIRDVFFSRVAGIVNRVELENLMKVIGRDASEEGMLRYRPLTQESLSFDNFTAMLEREFDGSVFIGHLLNLLKKKLATIVPAILSS